MIVTTFVLYNSHEVMSNAICEVSQCSLSYNVLNFPRALAHAVKFQQRSTYQLAERGAVARMRG